MIGHRGIFERDSVPDEVLRVSAAKTRIDEGVVDRGVFALRGQFGDERTFIAALHKDGIWRWQLRGMVSDAVRDTEWINKRIAEETKVSRDEARHYFDEHQADFALPLRLRPRHIFLAAPLGSEKVEVQRAAMEEIVARLQNGEDFASLAAVVSEDEASKSRGGDLGFLAANRVPAEFWSAIENLPVNGPVTFVQSHLGFHAVQILDARAARMMSFDEARAETEQILAGEKRRLAVGRIREQLAQQAILVSR